MYEDSDSCLWVSDIKGGIRKFPANAGFNDPRFKFYFPQNQITKVLEDSEHGFWFTTLNNGVIYVPYKRIEMLVSEDPKGEKGKILSVTTDHRSTLFAGTNTGEVKLFRHGKMEGSIPGKGYVHVLYYHEKARNLYISHNSGITIYSENGVKTEKKLGIISYQSDKNNVLYAGGFNGIIKDFPNHFWSYKRLFRIDALAVDSSNKLWMGTYLGLHYMEKGEIRKEKGSPLLDLRITALACRNDKIYMGTIQKGLLIYDGKQVEVFSTAQGLPSTIVNALLFQSDSILWVATSSGLSKLNLRSKKVLFTVDAKKGLCSNEVKDIKLMNDTLYLLTYEGISFFRSGEVFRNITAPAIYIKDVRVDTTSYQLEHNPVLNHARNYITFFVTGLAFREAGKVTYRYRLKGYSDNWKSTLSSQIQLAFVPPGSYTFEVVAENEDGVKSLQAATFPFIVSTPLWSQLWFQLTLGLLLISVSFFFFYLRLKRAREKSRIMEQLLNYKQQALTLQMNPHFIFNSLSSIQSYVLSEKSLKAAKYLAMFSKLIRRSLDHSRLEFVKLHEELSTLQLYVELERTRCKNRFSFVCEYEKTSFEQLLIPPMLIQPHIENAIKHGFMSSDSLHKEHYIHLSFTNRGGFLFCRIEDNGIGFSQTEAQKESSSAHRSAGLEVTRSRLELLCRNHGFPYHFSINSKSATEHEASGTLVEFLIPYIHETESTYSGRRAGGSERTRTAVDKDLSTN